MTAVRSTFKRGDIVFSEGGRAHNLYYIESGRVEVSRRERTGKRVLNRLSAGQTFGEYALLGGKKESRSATVTVLEDSELVVISRSALEKILTGVPGFVLSVISSVIDKMLELENRCFKMEVEARDFCLSSFVGMLGKRENVILERFPDYLKQYTPQQRQDMIVFMEELTQLCRQKYSIRQ
jgi:CRP-like cAMP-binding protein